MFGDYKDYDLIEEKSIDVRLKGPKVPLAIKCQGQLCYCDDRTRYESVAVAIVGGLQWYFFILCRFSTDLSIFSRTSSRNNIITVCKNMKHILVLSNHVWLDEILINSENLLLGIVHQI